MLFGWLPGGLGVVTVISCTMFGGVSGSAIADTAAIGSLVIPAMVARGYSRGFAAALLAVAGALRARMRGAGAGRAAAALLLTAGIFLAASAPAETRLPALLALRRLQEAAAHDLLGAPA